MLSAGGSPERLPTSEAQLRVVAGAAADFRFVDWSAGAEGQSAWAELSADDAWTIYDTNALSQSALAPTLASACDGVLLVGRLGATEEDALQRASLQLHQYGARVLGVVLC